MFNIDDIMSDLVVTLDCGKCLSKRDVKMIEMRERIICECGQVLASGDTTRLEKSIENLAIAHFEKFLQLNKKEI